MTHASGLLLLLRDGPKTLGEIFHADGGRYCAEYRKTFTLLRQEGYDLRLHTIRKHGSCPGCSVMGFPARDGGDGMTHGSLFSGIGDCDG